MDILETKKTIGSIYNKKDEGQVDHDAALAPTKKAYDAVKTAIAATHEAQKFLTMSYSTSFVKSIPSSVELRCY